MFYHHTVTSIVVVRPLLIRIATGESQKRFVYASIDIRGSLIKLCD